VTRPNSGLVENTSGVSIQAFSTLLALCSVQCPVDITHNHCKSIAVSCCELLGHFSTPLIAIQIDDRNSTHPYPPPTIDWLTTQMSKCKHGHDLTNNSYVRRTRNGKLRRTCKTCALIAAKKSSTSARKPLEVLAKNHANLEKRLEHAMPWDRDDIINRMKQLSKQMQ
jgi:hypothetical protein